MRYELIKNSHAGVIVDPTPVFLDIAETFKITFALPREGAYIALFRDEAGVEYKAVVYEDAVIVPREVIGKEQRVGLTVCLTDGDKILWAWECHPLKVGAFLYLRKTQWQLTAGFSDEELLARLAEIERIHAETEAAFAALHRDYDAQGVAVRQYMEQTAETIATFEKRLASVEKGNQLIAYAHNKATKVINDLQKKVLDLEKHYDPTLLD